MDNASAVADSEEFFVKVRPTRNGFRLHEGDDRMLRLWIGTSSTGQEMGLLSYGMFCETQLHGFDYTPVDLSTLPVFPTDLAARIEAVNTLVDSLKREEAARLPAPTQEKTDGHG